MIGYKDQGKRAGLYSRHGVGPLAFLIFIIALILIGCVSVYAYRQIHNKPTNSVHTTNTSAHGNTSTKQDVKASDTNTSSRTEPSTGKQDATSPTANYFTIAQWGVRASYSGSLNLQYTEKSSTSMALSSSQLAAGGPDVCAAVGNGDAGILGRYLPTDSNLGPKIPASETAEQYVQQNPSVPYAKVGSYIYIYWGNNYLTSGAYNGPCTDKNVGTQTIAAFSALVPKLQAVQQ